MVLPKLSLMRGDRMALQLTGGYWKEDPTDARQARATLTAAGRACSGPGQMERDEREEIVKKDRWTI